MAAYAVRPLTAAAIDRMTGNGTEISPFKASWVNTETLLAHELRQIGAADVVMMVDVSEGDLRIDGRMRSTARPMSPRVALAFEVRKRGSLLFCCGKFRNWQDNVRGLALGLEALRKLDRYGIVQSNEQYEGWRQIGTGDIAEAAGAPAARAWRVISDAAGMDVVDCTADPKTAYRNAAKATHPDQGGNAAAFRAVQEAAFILGLRS